jgi:hypothetical protein
MIADMSKYIYARNINCMHELKLPLLDSFFIRERWTCYLERVRHAIESCATKKKARECKKKVAVARLIKCALEPS